MAGGQNGKIQTNRCVILIGERRTFTAWAALAWRIFTWCAHGAIFSAWRAIFTRCTIFTGPVIAGTLLTGPVLTGAVFTRSVGAGAVLTLTVVIAWSAVAIPVAIVITRCAVTLPITLCTITGRTFTRRTFTGPPWCPADHVDGVERIFAIFAFGFIAIGACAVAAIVLPAVALIIALFIATALLLFLAAARVGKDAEIMVGKLQIIFGHHPIARKLGVAGHVAIFFEQLGGIATRPTVDPVGLIGIATLSTTLWAWTTIVVTPAPAAILLAIVHRHA